MNLLHIYLCCGQENHSPQSEDEDRHFGRLSEPYTDDPYDSGDDYEIPIEEEKVKATPHRRAATLPDTRYKGF